MEPVIADVPVLFRLSANSVYQFAEAATKFHIKDLFYAIRAHAFLMRQRIKQAFQNTPFIGFRHHAYVST